MSETAVDCVPEKPHSAIMASAERKKWVVRSKDRGAALWALAGIGCLTATPLVSCMSSGDSADPVGGQTGDEVTNHIQRVVGTVPRREAEGSSDNSAANELAQFAWDFYAESRDEEENFVYSPLSISVAASMLYAGTEAGTAEEMREVFSFAPGDQTFHQARNILLQALASRNHEATTEKSAQQLSLSNDFWMAHRLNPEPDFLNVLSEFYGAGMHLFEGSIEDVRVAINQKVSDDTNSLIDELLPGGSLMDDTIFVLTNALYFKANWMLPFDEERTESAPFTLLDGTSADVDMMRGMDFSLPYAETSEAIVVAMPYFGQELEFVAMMPPAGEFAAFLEDLSAAKVEELSTGLSHTNLDIQFPKISVDFTLPLKEELQGAGMLEAFSESEADFGPLSSNHLWIGAAYHQATVIIDEEGTEAAAATAFVGVDESAPPEATRVTFDRPFVFFIRDIESGAVLFVGHYVSPD